MTQATNDCLDKGKPGLARQNMADQAGRQRELVYCHACSNEWLRDQHGLQCPDCRSDAVEIVSPPIVELVCFPVKVYGIILKAFQTLTLGIDRLTSVMIHETIAATSAMMTTMMSLP